MKYYRMLLQEEQVYSKEFLVPVGDGEGWDEAETRLNNASLEGIALPDYSTWDRCEANVIGLTPDGDDPWDRAPEAIVSDKSPEELGEEYGAEVLDPNQKSPAEAKAALDIFGHECKFIPCMAGDSLYAPCRAGKCVTEYRVAFLTIAGGASSPRITVNTEIVSGPRTHPCTIPVEEIGKGIFPTRGEAQAALDALLDKKGA